MTNRTVCCVLFLVATLLGCKGSGATPEPSAEGAGTPAAEPGLPDGLVDLPWQWSGGQDTRFYQEPVSVLAPDGDTFVFTHSEHPDRDTLRRVGPEGEERWSVALEPEFVANAALLLGGDTLYIAHYSTISSGTRLLAFDAGSGKQRWAQQLQALGPVEHSEYYNEVRLRELHDHIVVYGNESQGHYIEVVDPASGATRSNRRFPS